MRHAGVELPGFRHEALFYADDEELLAGLLPAIRETLVRDGGVLIALPRASARVVQEGLGPAAHDVTFADMDELGRNPGRIIPAWRDFVHAHASGGNPPLGIGQPVWPGRSDAEIAECARHETLLNLAFSPGPDWRMLCPFDASQLEPEVLECVGRNHPHVVEHGVESGSDAFTREIPPDEPLPPPGADAGELPFTFGGLGLVREFVTTRAQGAGLSAPRIADLVLAIDELATNTLLYAGGEGVVRAWREDGALLCEIADSGHIADPLAGRELPPPDQLRGRGLWVVNQLCDLVQLRSRPGHSTVRVRMRADASR